MIWEQEDESSYIPPPPAAAPPPHVFDMIPPSVKTLFDDILKYRVDPAGTYYGITLENVVDQVKQLTTAQQWQSVQKKKIQNLKGKARCMIHFCKVLY